MTKKAIKPLAERAEQALQALTPEELSFFPKADPMMLRQPDAPWGKSGDQRRQERLARRTDCEPPAHSSIL